MSGRGRRERNVLVATELALSLVLLIRIRAPQLREAAQCQPRAGLAVPDLLTFSVALQGDP